MQTSKQRNTRIVVISETFPPDVCGVADYVLILCQYLSEYYDVYVITRQFDSPKIYNLGNVTVCEVIDSKLYIFKVLNILNEISPHIIDVQLSYSSASEINSKNLFSPFYSLLIRKKFSQSVLCCTVHELSSLLETNSWVIEIYRKIRDYGHTLMFDHYFCADARYLNCIKASDKSFLANYSNIPTFKFTKKIDSYNLLYFGTINQKKQINKLINLFFNLLERDKLFHMTIVGAVSESYRREFEDIIKLAPAGKITYLDYLDKDDIESVIDKCSYAIFPFPVTDRNASVLAMLVNGLIVIAECEDLPHYSTYGNNFYRVQDVSDVKSVYEIIVSNLGKCTHYLNNDQIINNHIKKRKKIYQTLLEAKRTKKRGIMESM